MWLFCMEQTQTWNYSKKISEFVSLSRPSLLGKKKKKKKSGDILLMLRGKPSEKRDPNSGIFLLDFMFSSGVIWIKHLNKRLTLTSEILPKLVKSVEKKEREMERLWLPAECYHSLVTLINVICYVIGLSRAHHMFQALIS